MKSLITILLINISFVLYSQDNIDLYVWAGQSNALGRKGDAAQYPADPNNLDNSIHFNWTVPNGGNSGGWTKMGPQDLGHYFTAGHFGPEVTFSRKLVQAGHKTAIFKYAQGATSIFEHWLNPGSGGLYDAMVTSLNNAITELEVQGHSVTIKGLIWIQGESDSNSDAAANAYLNNLTTLIEDFRNNVAHNSNLPIILGVDEQFFNLSGRQRPQILNAHQDIALNDDNIKFTSMYGFPKAEGDDTHLTPAGLISHGEAIFDAYQELILGQHPLESCTLTSSGTEVSYERAVWGQSFTTDCSGEVESITFSAASLLDNSATFNLYNSADCSGTILYTQKLNNIVVGNNTVTINNGLYLDKEYTYYLEIVSDDINEFWRINYSKTDNVFGMLRTYQEPFNCGRSFSSFDMNFSVKLYSKQGNECTLTSAGNDVSFERASWGQSFSTDCTGKINSITFSVAESPNESAIFTLYEGEDCNGTLLYTQALSTISTGKNKIDINNSLSLNENNTYFFQIVSKNDALWRIHYSKTDNVSGKLYTFKNGSYCGRSFPNFDMNFSVVLNLNGQCASPENVYSFVYDNRTYQIVRENKAWVAAASCAVHQGGKLVEINDQSEQNAIFKELQNNAAITLKNTVAKDGGNASYIWIGANDIANEGKWIWDGDNDNIGSQFWEGGRASNGGKPVDGLYNNWGKEPDNWENRQHAAGIALTQWPVNSGSLGTAGQWNDIDQTNKLYFIIEYSTILGNSENVIDEILVFPNPTKDFLVIKDNKHEINEVKIFNIQGEILKTIKLNNPLKTVRIDFSSFNNGIYILGISTKNNGLIIKKIVK